MQNTRMRICAGIVTYNPNIDRLRENYLHIRDQVDVIIICDNGSGNLNEIKEILDDKKGIDSEIIHVGEKTTLTEYFVLVTGTSSTHVKALAGEVEAKLSEEGIVPLNFERKMSDSWIALDYKDVILHIFSKETRELYNLEKLWK